MKDFMPWEAPHAGAGKLCVKEQAVERSRYERTTTPIPHFPVCLKREEVEELGVKE